MTTKKKIKTRKSKKETSPEFAKPTLKLIDQAADLLKNGVIFGAKQGVRGRQILKNEASDLISAATDRLNKALNQGLDALSKKLKKR